MTQGIEQGSDLEPVGHIFNGRGKAGEDDRRHHEDKGSQESLLHGHGQRRNEKTDAHNGDDETSEGQNKGPDAAAERHTEPVNRTCGK